jgi:hypothetical protein
MNSHFKGWNMVLQDLQTRFTLNIHFKFGFLTADDEFPIFPFSKKKTGLCIYEVQVKENYRHRGHKRVWDMVWGDYGNCEFSWKCALIGCLMVWISEGDY